MNIEGSYPLSIIYPISDSVTPLFSDTGQQGTQLGLGTDIVATANPLVDDQGILNSIGADIKSAIIGLFDTIGQSYQKATQPAFNQLLIVLIIVIVAIFLIGQSKMVKVNI